ncbi:MAG TPA: phospho-N-acetylmuramoyl-pentapeptide-transferase [Mobilitalea sp.]|nr:phospho-N-acetylmuramoyl-pentapeptide-transferase [Mobilitalea sp.]
MIYWITNIAGNNKVLAFIGMLVAYAATCFLLGTYKNLLPRDGGRDFAHNGKLSAGKPRGAGFVFIIVFILINIIFLPFDKEVIVYLILTAAIMLTGFLDDCAKSPWDEYKKGLLDLAIAVATAVAFVNFNSTRIDINIIGKSIVIPPVVFIILAVILIWTSINVTNCSDGVDGLCGVLSIITMLTIYMIGNIKGMSGSFNYLILIMVECVMGYLWYNASPSKMIMGDAGSRALGFFISIMILKTGSPLLFIPAAFVLIVDGGIGLIKVSLLRFFKIRILTNVRTPLHDHVRKNMKWSDTQAVFRFAIIQVVISFALFYLLNK